MKRQIGVAFGLVMMSASVWAAQRKPLVDRTVKFDAPGPATKLPVADPNSGRRYEATFEAVSGYGGIGHIELAMRLMPAAGSTETTPRPDRGAREPRADRNLLADGENWHGMERYMIWPQQLAAGPELGSEFGRVRIFFVDDLELRVEILSWTYNRPARATDWRTDLGFQDITLHVVITRNPVGRHLSD